MVHKKVETVSNVYRTKVLRTIHFENSVLGRTLGLLGMNYMTNSERVEALTLIREKK